MKKALLIAAAIATISTQASSFETKDIPKHCDDVAESIKWKDDRFPKQNLDSDRYEYLLAPHYITYATFIKYGDTPKEIVWIEDKKSYLAFLCNEDDTGKVVYIPQSKYKIYIKVIPEDPYFKDKRAIEKSILE